MVAICERTHIGVISILGIIIVSCDRLLERDWCVPYGARATHAIKAFAKTPSQCFRRGGLARETRIGHGLFQTVINSYKYTIL